jgi:hypothetical protein
MAVISKSDLKVCGPYIDVWRYGRGAGHCMETYKCYGSNQRHLYSGTKVNKKNIRNLEEK